MNLLHFLDDEVFAAFVELDAAAISSELHLA